MTAPTTISTARAELTEARADLLEAQLAGVPREHLRELHCRVDGLERLVAWMERKVA